MSEIIEQWFRDHFCGLGPRIDQDLWNEFHAAKEELKARCATAIPSAPAPAAFIAEPPPGFPPGFPASFPLAPPEVLPPTPEPATPAEPESSK